MNNLKEKPWCIYTCDGNQDIDTIVYFRTHSPSQYIKLQGLINLSKCLIEAEVLL